MKTNFKTILLLSVMHFMVSIIGNAQSPNLLREENFDTELDNSKWRKHLGYEHSGMITNTVGRGGSGNSFKFNLRKSDSLFSVSGHVYEGVRAELSTSQIPTSTTGHSFKYGEEFWYAISIYIPTDWEIDPRKIIGGIDVTNHDILTQFHYVTKLSTDKNGTPNLAISIYDSHWKITYSARPPGSTITGTPSTPNIQGDSIYQESIDIKKGEWTDWVINAKWSYSDQGFLKIWQNQKLLVTHAGHNCYQNRDVYMKYGDYKPRYQDGRSAVNERTVYHDAIKILNSQSCYEEASVSCERTLTRVHDMKLTFPTTATGVPHFWRFFLIRNTGEATIPGITITTPTNVIDLETNLLGRFTPNRAYSVSVRQGGTYHDKIYKQSGCKITMPSTMPTGPGARIGDDLSGNDLNSPKIEIYPVPFTNQLNMKVEGVSGNYDVEIHTLQGRSIFKRNSISVNRVCSIKENIIPGMYLVTIKLAGKIYSYKVYKNE